MGVALLALNAVLLVAQPGLALPRSLESFFYGPAMVRAEVIVKTGGVVHDYRLDRGRIRSVAGDTIVLRERDGLVVTVRIADDAAIRGRRGAARALTLRRGMLVETIRDGDEPAETVVILRR